MLGLNPVLLVIGASMYIIPTFAVITAVTTCSCIIIRYNRLEKEYINKHKLIADELKELDYEDLIKNEYKITSEIESSESDFLLGDLLYV